jgi:hypothetical protein
MELTVANNTILKVITNKKIKIMVKYATFVVIKLLDNFYCLYILEKSICTILPKSKRDSIIKKIIL